MPQGRGGRLSDPANAGLVIRPFGASEKATSGLSDLVSREERSRTRRLGSTPRTAQSGMHVVAALLGLGLWGRVTARGELQNAHPQLWSGEGLML